MGEPHSFERMLPIGRWCTYFLISRRASIQRLEAYNVALNSYHWTDGTWCYYLHWSAREQHWHGECSTYFSLCFLFLFRKRKRIVFWCFTSGPPIGYNVRWPAAAGACFSKTVLIQRKKAYREKNAPFFNGKGKVSFDPFFIYRNVVHLSVLSPNYPGPIANLKMSPKRANPFHECLLSWGWLLIIMLSTKVFTNSRCAWNSCFYWLYFVFLPVHPLRGTDVSYIYHFVRDVSSGRFVH